MEYSRHRHQGSGSFLLSILGGSTGSILGDGSSTTGIVLF